MSTSAHTPTYRKHKQSGQAIVTLPDGFGGRRDVTGSSFSFGVQKQAFVTADDPDVEELYDVDLYDCGPVSFPAYKSTTVSVGRMSRSVHRPCTPRADVLARAHQVETEMHRLGARRYFACTPAATKDRAREVLKELGLR
jgi:hypothetical protein